MPSPSPEEPESTSLRHFLAQVGVETHVYLDPEDLLGDGEEPAAAGDDERLGRYAVVGRLGAGGMGDVLDVLDETIGRRVAAKVVRGNDRQTLERFVIEAQIAGQLDHPNIVPVHELDRTPDGRVYFTMRRLPGIDLEGRLSAESDAPRGELLRIFLKICDAIAFAHDRGVIHRDLKPANVLVGRFGEVQVTDWGLAKLAGRPDPTAGGVTLEASVLDAGQEGSSELRTLDGTILGTPAYMPPEQARGRVGELDERSDIYSLGAILYRILTGQHPVAAGTTFDLLARVVAGRVVPPRQRAPDRRIDRELEAIVLRAMSRAKQDRYPSVRALQTDVERHLASEPVSVVDYRSWETLERWMGRHRGPVRVAGIALVLGVVLLAASLARISREREAAIEAERGERGQRLAAQASQAAAESALTRVDEERRRSERLLAASFLRAAETARLENDSQSMTLLAWRSHETLPGPRSRALYLLSDSLLRDRLDTLVGHGAEDTSSSSPVVGLSYLSGDCGILLSVGVDGTVRLWNEATGAIEQVLGDFERRLVWAEAGAEGSILVVGEASGAVRILERETGREVTQVFRNRRGVDIAPAGPARLLVVDGSGVTILDATTGQSLIRHPADGGRVRAARWAPDGLGFVLVSAGRPAELLDAGTGEVLQTFEGVEPGADRVSFSPHGRTIAIGEQLFDVETGRRTLTLEGALVVDIAPGRRRVVGARAPTGFRLLDEEGRTLAEGEGRAGPFRSDGSVFFTNDLDRVVLRSAENGVVLGSIRAGGEISTVAWSRDGQRIALGRKDGQIEIWRADPAAFQLPTGRGGFRTALGRDGRRLVLVSAGGTVRRVDVETGRAGPEFDLDVLTSELLYLSDDGSRLLLVDQGEGFRLVELDEGQVLLRLEGWWPRFAAGGDALLVTEIVPKDPAVRVHDVRTGQLRGLLPGDVRQVGPTGTRLLTTRRGPGGGEPVEWLLHDLTTAETIASLVTGSKFGDLEFAAGGSVVVTSERFGLQPLRIWKSGDGAPVDWPVPEGEGCAVAPSGRRLAVVDRNGRCWLHEVGGQELPRMIASGVGRARFTPSGSHLILEDLDGRSSLVALDGQAIPPGASHGPRTQFSADGRHALFERDAAFELVELESGRVLARESEVDGVPRLLEDLSVVRITRKRGNESIRDVATGRALLEFDRPGEVEFGHWVTLDGDGSAALVPARRLLERVARSDPTRDDPVALRLRTGMSLVDGRPIPDPGLAPLPTNMSRIGLDQDPTPPDLLARLAEGVPDRAALDEAARHVLAAADPAARWIRLCQDLEPASCTGGRRLVVLEAIEGLLEESAESVDPLLTFVIDRQRRRRSTVALSAAIDWGRRRGRQPWAEIVIEERESGVVYLLEEMAREAALFRGALRVDVDGDRIGEYGFLQEILGFVPPRGRTERVGRKHFSRSFSDLGSHDGIGTASGYAFLVHLPGAEGPVRERSPLLGPRVEDADHQEDRYLLYAWPLEHGWTGRRVFVVDADSTIHVADNVATGYSGFDRLPPARAALRADEAGPGLTGSIGGRGVDGQEWRLLGR